MFYQKFVPCLHLVIKKLNDNIPWEQLNCKKQGVKARMLGRQNERNFCYDRLALPLYLVCV